MGFRFRRSIRIAPGLRLNVSKSGIGLSAGGRGFRVGLGPRGPYVSAGIPGTGLSWYQPLTSRARRPRRAGQPAATTPAAATPSSPAVYGQPVAAPAAAGWGGLLLVAGLILVWTSLAPAAIPMLAGGFLLVARAWRTPAMQAYREEAQAVQLYRNAITRNQRELLERAFQHALRCLELQSDAQRARYVAGMCLVELGRPQEAVPYLEPLDGEEPGLLLDKLRLYTLLAQYEKVLAILHRLPEALQDALPLRNLRAAAHLELGEADVALEILRTGPVRRRLDDDPDLITFHYLLGRCYEALGRRAPARRAYARVVAADPDFADAQERLQELR